MIRSSHGGAAARPPKRDAPTKLPRSADRPEGEARERARPPRARQGAGAKGALPKGGLASKGAFKEGPRKAKPPAPTDGRSASAASRVPAGVSTASDEAREVAVLIAVAAIEKKASGLEVIDVAGRVDYADFLVLMSGRSDRHVTALSAAIEEALRKRNKRAIAVEGLPHASWVLMDFGDVVVHVFQDDARAAYDIDGLWMDARRVPVPLSEPRA
ncbi:MAG: ribosome silencing factor [Labilithrix sp.]|nr:ribosome silencing factor [Labilithrix sp.]MBX3222568.1 ribosome silencing factor [Labilithrix sp.]